MKTLFVCSDKRLDHHAGEEYDEIIEVPHQPVVSANTQYGYTPENATIEPYAKAIRNAILDLWEQDSESENRSVKVWLDAHSAFNAMLIDYKATMYNEHGIVIELPYLDKETRTTNDRETEQLLNRMEN